MFVYNRILKIKTKLYGLLCAALFLVLLTACTEADTSNSKTNTSPKNNVSLERCLTPISLPQGFNPENVAGQERPSRQYKWFFNSKKEFNNDGINFEFVDSVYVFVNCHDKNRKIRSIRSMKNECNNLKKEYKGKYEIKLCQVSKVGDMHVGVSTAIETKKLRRHLFSAIVRKKSAKIKLFVFAKRDHETEANRIFDRLLSTIIR
ncbi:MAG: hypothetical protein V3V04_04900 [Rhizobiaceae bacterium]